jgi:hypothetical protein
LKKYKIVYHFEKELQVVQTVEAEIKEEVIGNTKDLTGFVEFTSDDDIYHRFNIDDVKLVTITEA